MPKSNSMGEEREELDSPPESVWKNFKDTELMLSFAMLEPVYDFENLDWGTDDNS